MPRRWSINSNRIGPNTATSADNLLEDQVGASMAGKTTAAPNGAAGDNLSCHFQVNRFQVTVTRVPTGTRG